MEMSVFIRNLVLYPLLAAAGGMMHEENNLLKYFYINVLYL